MELSERKLKILQAIISDFIRTAEPIGSRTLSKKFDLGISPATIRNEMADLEEMGYLTHPHTSAGRVPSELAYRLYVNDMMKKYELTEEEKNAIASKLYENVTELEKTVQHAAKILSDITNLTSFALTPSPDEDTLKYINLLPVDEHTVVLMIVSHSGKVSNTALKLKVPYTEDGLELLAKTMTYNYRGKTLSQVLTLDIIESFETDIEAMSALAKKVVPNFIKTLEDMLNVNLYMDGLTNIFSIPEYNDLDKAKMFLEMLGKKEDFTKTLINRENGVIITIGKENTEDIMQDCSLITATYHVDGKLAGKIGVIGPTRMRYGQITSVVEYLTENISNTFKLSGGGKDDD
ncbi:heat-inducible transcriptional repressor HrcA [Anaerovorax odorimutans]|uniref:Heat-inducible transcription repressor HrcA n=1 Tax=Anaerovorax odorimutans TaxID=109327 RepID=A0ABT1RM18_9FIRM|nr:heat-inducible transcriptional repressor HrcA [Anaerovorax odorimutans]MCQ4636228.1 heat-inducible transcriptional repressor HrcA [Anaerovorax odorimutans]